MDGPSDRELLAAHAGGEPDAFATLFTRHRDRLWAVALRTTGNPDDAADGLQDGLIAAYRRAATYRGEAAVTTWLHRVVVNACLDRLRAAKVRRADPLPDDLDDTARRGAAATTGAQGRDRAGPGLRAPESGADPVDVVVASERRARVLAALATLAPEQRAAIVLVDLEGYPVADVAQMLDCAVGTVKSRCSRGRTRLAELLVDLVVTTEPDAGSPGNRSGNPPGARTVPPVRPRGPPDQPTPRD